MLKLYNTLSRRIEKFALLEPEVCRMYTCGPTVYRHAHLGNLRSYLMADWLRRAMEHQGVRVVHVKNITDVGHMRQEMLERGEDKVVATALAEGKTPQEIARHYAEVFFNDEAKVNILPAHHFPKASEHVEDMVRMVELLIELGYAYEVGGNVYFAVSKFPEYGKLSGNIEGSELLEALRMESDPLKKDPRDFTLWKGAEPARVLKWPSPWGDGFPGWHIECSAMAAGYLGEQLDIHTGGVDNIFPHHEGEIAQSEGAFGKRFVNVWLHGEHLLADGVKMAKSAGNSYTIADIQSQGIDPLAFRYLCLTVRYRTRLNFTFSSLKAAQKALLRLKNRVWEWMSLPPLKDEHEEAEEIWRSRFLQLVSDDLNMPGALALVWEMSRSTLPGYSKLRLLLDFDHILGLDLQNVPQEYQVPQDIVSLTEERALLRERRMYEEADNLRIRLDREGYIVEDTPSGSRIRPKVAWEKHEGDFKTISSSKEVSSRIDESDKGDFTLGIVACNYIQDVQRCVESALNWSHGYSVELLVVDNGSTDGTRRWLKEKASQDTRLRVIYADHILGEGAAKNIILKQSTGRIVVLLDTSVETLGDIMGPLKVMFSESIVGVAGPFGLRTEDLRHFHEPIQETAEVDAIQAYCFAFRRELIKSVGFFRESFRFYRNLDLDYSFQFKEKGYRIVSNPGLPVVRHEHRLWDTLSQEEQQRLSTKNYRRFLDKWRNRSDLLIANQLKSETSR
ncbi:MAG: cysteine--tRNA ligase, partial [Chloroflexi bacterium]|nr:cysteine--tRNA ligase [Chloroflexota bacterium]